MKRKASKDARGWGRACGETGWGRRLAGIMGGADKEIQLGAGSWRWLMIKKKW